MTLVAPPPALEFGEPPHRTQLRAGVRRAVEEHSTHAQIRAVMEEPDPLDPRLWRALSEELGVTGILHGGPASAAGSFADLAVVLEELGRGPACGPFLGTAVLAPALLSGCGGQAAGEVWDHLRRPGARATASLEHDVTDLRSLSVHASRDGERHRLRGVDPFVVDAPRADLLLLPATLEGHLAVFAVGGGTPGVACEPLMTMDQTRRVGRLRLDDAEARLLAVGEPAARALSQARRLAQVALACEQVGGAARCLELSVEYAKQRRQFGVPIGSFQAVKHSCADMVTAVELARSTATYAAYCVDNRPDDLPTAALVAASLCSESYLAVSAAAIQVHGGIGFTWDNYCHLYFKRAKSTGLMFGRPEQCRAELAALIGL